MCLAIFSTEHDSLYWQHLSKHINMCWQHLTKHGNMCWQHLTEHSEMRLAMLKSTQQHVLATFSRAQHVLATFHRAWLLLKSTQQHVFATFNRTQQHVPGGASFSSHSDCKTTVKKLARVPHCTCLLFFRVVTLASLLVFLFFNQSYCLEF